MAHLFPAVCNFMSHEKCLKQVKTPCTSIAPSLVRVSVGAVHMAFMGLRADLWLSFALFSLATSWLGSKGQNSAHNQKGRSH